MLWEYQLLSCENKLRIETKFIYLLVKREGDHFSHPKKYKLTRKNLKTPQWRVGVHLYGTQYCEWAHKVACTLAFMFSYIFMYVADYYWFIFI